MPQNSCPITVVYDGWALVECIAYRQENFKKCATGPLKKGNVYRNLTNTRV